MYIKSRLKFLEKRDINRNDRFIQYGLIASKMAIEDAGISDLPENAKLRVGVTVGSGIGGLKPFIMALLLFWIKVLEKFLLFLFLHH